MILARYPQKTFTPCPEGLHHAVCCDVVDLGEVDTHFGRKYRVRLAWQIDELDPESNTRHDVIKSYTNSLHRRANLRADLESWRGQKFTEAEARAFDLETLLGKNCMIHVVHETSDAGDIYANVRAIMPTPQGTALLVPLDYTRAKDRNGAAQTARAATATSSHPIQPPLAATPTADDAPAAPDDDVDDITFAMGGPDTGGVA